MKHIICLNQKSITFILFLNSKTHSPGDTLNLKKQPSEKSWLVKHRRKQKCTAGHFTVHLKPTPGHWPSPGCQAAVLELLCCAIAGNPNHTRPRQITKTSISN